MAARRKHEEPKRRNLSVATDLRLGACETEAAAWRESPVAASPLCVKRRSNVPQRYMSRPSYFQLQNKLQFNDERRRFQQVVFGS